MKKREKVLIYQVLPRLFGNDKVPAKPNGTLKENGVGKFADFTPEALSEIRKMGFNYIWYTGVIEHATKTDYSEEGIQPDYPAVVKGNAGSPYAIKDYYDVNPDYALQVKNRMEEFEALVERSHQSKLKVIIDFVPNHVARRYCSDCQPSHIAEFGKNDNTHTTFSPDNNFYYIPGQAFCPGFDLNEEGKTYEESPAKATGNDCFRATPGNCDWYETVKLNYGVDYLSGGMKYFNPVPDTWTKMRDVLMFWAGKKIDGFRCDMAEMVPVEFWAWVIPQVREKYPAILFIAEIYNANEYRKYIEEGKFDYLYDKVGLYDTLRRIICHEQSAKDITGCWQALEGIQDKMLNFLENHDEQRIASAFFAGDPWRAVPAMIVSATMNTNPVMIYFGQELGEKGMDQEGFSGLDGRTTIYDYWSISSIRNWRNKGKFDGKKLTVEQTRLREFYTKLLQLCNKEKAIREGLFYDLMYANYQNALMNIHTQYTFLRYVEGQLLLIIVNFEKEDREAAVYIPAHVFEFFEIDPDKIGTGKDLLSGEKINILPQPDALFPVIIKGNSGKIIKFSVR